MARIPSVALASRRRSWGSQSSNGRVGTLPAGGKFGGYDYNGFAAGLVDECGFLWWCRDWMPRDVTGRVPDDYYEPQFFGRNMLVALPSTVHGHPGIPGKSIAAGQAPADHDRRAHCAGPADGLTQTPNIIDDMIDLRRLYAFLRGCASGTRRARNRVRMSIARERTLSTTSPLDGFSIRYDDRVERPSLTLAWTAPRSVRRRSR